MPPAPDLAVAHAINASSDCLIDRQDMFSAKHASCRSGVAVARAFSPCVEVGWRIGMRNTGRDFEHPAVPEGNPLRPHCLYVITRKQWHEDGNA